MKSYDSISDFKPTIPVKSIQGDICNLQDFSRAVKGADCVIHVAGVISIGNHPDVKKMQAINIDGKIYLSFWVLFFTERSSVTQLKLKSVHT